MTFKALMTALVLAAALTATARGDAVEVENAWVRATVKGQQASGAFMTLTAKDGARLVGVASPMAGVTQVHQMTMESGVMKMGEVKGGLELPAGKAVELKSGGYHVMLMDLKAPLTQGSRVPLTLVFRDAKGVQSQLELKVPVAAIAPAGMAHGKDAKTDHSMPGNTPATKAP